MKDAAANLGAKALLSAPFRRRHLPDVQALLLGDFEIIPLLEWSAVDVPAILLRAPQVCLIDGLAWTNPPGSPNAERWQDIEQLLRAKINVLTSINLQYVAEHRQQVERITGKHIEQTVPLSFLSRADEVVIVDAPIEELEITDARRKQLSELREIALLLAAEVVDNQLADYLRRNGIRQSFGIAERILICLTPRTNPAKMLRSGQRIAQRFHGELIAVSVGQPDLSADDRASLDRNLEASRNAGAEVVTLDGEDAIETILAFATKRGVTQIFIGHGQPRGFLGQWTKSPVDRLLAAPRGIDVRVFPH